MFDSLKKKFSSWLGKEEPKKEEKEKPSKKKGKKEKAVKLAKQVKAKEVKEEIKEEKQEKQEKHSKKRERTANEITQEREISDKVIEDIKKEGIDTTSPDVKVQRAIEEIKLEEKEEAEIEEENIELEQEKQSKEGAEQKSEEKKGKKSWWPFKKKKEEKEEAETDKKAAESETESNEQTATKEGESFFSKLAKKLATSRLKDEDFEEAFQDLEITLLENNTALEAVDKIKSSLKTSLVNKEIKKDKIKDTIIQSLKDAILSVLIEPPNLIEQIEKKNKNNEPYVILFFGINGSGKTTSIAKLSHLLKKQNLSVVLAAADTFRAASIEQLKTHAEKLNIPVIAHDYGSDPAAVAFDAIKYAKQHKIDVVLIDTAGRMYTKTNLLKEMEKIVRVSKPDLKIFVGESITGNDATEQAKTFNESIGIDGIILSKADVDEKAGTILSVSQVTNKPIYFLGIGQEYKDLETFSKSVVLKNLGLE